VPLIDAFMLRCGNISQPRPSIVTLSLPLSTRQASRIASIFHVTARSTVVNAGKKVSKKIQRGTEM
jgi:hypothetical protein